MNDLDEYIHRCRLNLEPHHLQPADETDDKHCIICDISGARRHIRMDGLCINCWSNGDANTTPHTASESTTTNTDGNRSTPTNSGQ